jgi:hypothetical protein
VVTGTGKGITGHLCLLIRFTQDKSKFFFIFVVGNSFTNWSKGPTKIDDTYPPTKTSRQEHYLPWCLHFEEMSPRLLRKTFLGNKAGRKLGASDSHL